MIYSIYLVCFDDFGYYYYGDFGYVISDDVRPNLAGIVTGKQIGRAHV